MKKLALIVQLCLLTGVIYCQESQNYEQIGFDFFVKNIVVKEFSYVKLFVYDGAINFSNNGYSDCMYIKEDDMAIHDMTKTIDFEDSNGVRIVKKAPFFEKLFTNKFRIKTLNVFKSYIAENEVMTCILVSGESEYVYFNFKINPQTNQVENYCKIVMTD